MIPITDPRMTRFWITLGQGIEFVLSGLETMRGGEIFIPKIPSMKVTEVAEVVAPGCKQEIIGIRPGEKLHEIMITPDDALNTAEFARHFVIQPAAHWWDQKAYLKSAGAKPVAEDFQYSSDRNAEWLTRPQLAGILEHEAIEL